jgi:hypothetical protein
MLNLFQHLIPAPKLFQTLMSSSLYIGIPFLIPPVAGILQPIHLLYHTVCFSLRQAFIPGKALCSDTEAKAERWFIT